MHTYIWLYNSYIYINVCVYIYIVFFYLFIYLYAIIYVFIYIYMYTYYIQTERERERERNIFMFSTKGINSLIAQVYELPTFTYDLLRFVVDMFTVLRVTHIMLAFRRIVHKSKKGWRSGQGMGI